MDARPGKELAVGGHQSVCTHVGRFQTIVILLLMTGCATAPRHPVPKETASTVQLPNFNEMRIVVDPNATNFLSDLAGLLKGIDTSGGPDHHVNILALSGGGENGAYGAGLLCGWTEATNRPQFDVVTAISTVPL